MKNILTENQKLKCPECGKEFEFDPNSEEHSIGAADSDRLKTRTIEVTAYLDCPLGHTSRYRVKKNYEEVKPVSLWSKLQQIL